MNYTESTMAQSLRNQSDMARPSPEFTSHLKEELMQKTEKKQFWQLPQWKIILPVVLFFVSFFGIGGLVLWNAREGKIIMPGNRGNSPVLDMFGIKSDDEFSKRNGYLEREGEGSTKSGGGGDMLMLHSETTDAALPPVPNQTQGVLKGGEVDDNELFEQYLEYVHEQNHTKLTREIFEDRYRIRVVDDESKGVLGQELTVTDSNGQVYKLTTDADGEIYFFPKLYSAGSQQSGNIEIPSHYRIVTNNQEFEFAYDQKDWEMAIDRSLDNITGLTLDLVFVIDTTGSMSDQIQKLRETIDTISQMVSEMENAPSIRYGMVLYRDKTDEYVTRIYDFTDSLSEFRSRLDTVTANGGGDYPEDVNTALKDTMEQLSWSDKKNSVRLAFLVADAPPHNDYGQEYDYMVASLRAMELGVKIYPLASSGLDNTEGELIFRELAIVTNAKYIFITNAGGGTDYHVDEQSYTVSALDELITNVIEEEIGSVR